MQVVAYPRDDTTAGRLVFCGEPCALAFLGSPRAEPVAKRAVARALAMWYGDSQQLARPSGATAGEVLRDMARQAEIADRELQRTIGDGEARLARELARWRAYVEWLRAYDVAGEKGRGPSPGRPDHPLDDTAARAQRDQRDARRALLVAEARLQGAVWALERMGYEPDARGRR